MSSELGFVEYVAEQMAAAGQISFRKMFGEYAIYCGIKVVALVCDDRLYVKQTAAGREFIGEVVEAPPYPNARLHFLIEDRLDDRAWLAELIRVTAQELPDPKPKKPKRPKPKPPSGEA
jgi:TfoX/Sxy family transcriptional regulator of competence genes